MMGLGYEGSALDDQNRYGAFQNVASSARQAAREGLGSARRDMAQSVAAMTSAGANPFGAARAANRSYQAQAGDIMQRQSEQMQQAAAMEARRREEEALRKQQEARQFLSGGLSTAGAVLGTVVGGPLGSQIGSGLGGAVGGGLTGIGGQPAAAKPVAGQPAAAKPLAGQQVAQPQQGQPAGQPAASTRGPQLQPPQGGMAGAPGGGGGLGGFAQMLNPFSLFGVR